MGVTALDGPRYSVAQATVDSLAYGLAWGSAATALGAAIAGGGPAARVAAGARIGLPVVGGFVTASVAEAAGYGALARRGVDHQAAHAVTSGVILTVSGAGLAASLAGRAPRALAPAFAGAALIGACVAVSALTGGADPLHRVSGFHDIGR